MDWATLFIAFSIGLLGGAHCVGMCGGIMGALTMAVADSNYRRRWCFIALYNVGRITSYVLIAWVFYQFVVQLRDYFAFQFMRYIAGLLLIAMGLYLANWWRGLVYLEKIGGHLWRFIQPLSRALLPVNSAYKAFFLGFVWGWLPCGLIYSALAYSLAADTSVQAATTMLAFALGTLPAVMVSGLLAERLAGLIKNTLLRRGFALLIITFGVWTLLMAYQHSHHVGAPLFEASPSVLDQLSPALESGGGHIIHHH
jgi:sulfite exporter TauE/SafE